MLDISVILCSHNPRPNYLRRALDALRCQTLPQRQWELLLIDNASDKALARDWDLSWHPNGRHILETELGLSAARLRGMRESSAEVIIFVDDDNVLDPDYLSVAVGIDRGWPKLGTWGSGTTLPEFEVQPSVSLKDFLPYLALRDTTMVRWGNVSTQEVTPWGAGLCTRRKVADAYLRHWEDSTLRIMDRKGISLLSGGDVEISYVARDVGLGTGVFPELRLVHLIPKERVSLSYLLKLYQASWTTHFLLTYKWIGTIPSHPFGRHALLSTLKNLIMLRGLQRQQYLATGRAALDARRIITASREQAERAGRRPFIDTPLRAR
jgi:glycosyltransferase involved in cell wall biosynthesis